MEMILVARRNKIKQILEQRDLSIYWLANEIDMSYQAIHKLVNSNVIPGGTEWDTLRKIAEVLNVSVDALEENNDAH